MTRSIASAALALAALAGGEAHAGFLFTFTAGYGHPWTTRDAVASALGSEPYSYGTTPRQEAQLLADELAGGLVLVPEIGWRFSELVDLGLSFTAMGWRIPDPDRGGLGYPSAFVALRLPAAITGLVDLWARVGGGWMLFGGGHDPNSDGRGASGFTMDLGLGVDLPLGAAGSIGLRARTFIPFFDTYWVRFNGPQFTYPLPAPLEFHYLDVSLAYTIAVKD